jgi:hypothetical protein
MKDFDDLVFTDKNCKPLLNKRSEMFFDNGYGVSVINGKLANTVNDQQFEVAVIDSNCELVYDTPVTSSVLGHLEADDVSEVMKQVQLLPKREK